MTFLKQELIDAGFDPKEPVEGILIVENFITSSELSEFWDIINSTPEEQWFVHYRDHLAKFCMEKFGRDDVENLVAEGKYEITRGWDDKNLLVISYPVSQKVTTRLTDLIAKSDPNLHLSFGIFQRMQKGVELKAHTDQHTDPSIKYAAVLYLNEDYTDGEIFWPNKDFEIKPKTGSLIMFPGTDEFNHGVKHVGDGPIRYVMPGFIKVADFYEKNKY
jgi:hypothetical protein